MFGHKERSIAWFLDDVELDRYNELWRGAQYKTGNYSGCEEGANVVIFGKVRGEEVERIRVFMARRGGVVCLENFEEVIIMMIKRNNI